MTWFYILLVPDLLIIPIGGVLLFSGLFVQVGTDATVFSTSGGILLATAGWLLTSAITLRMKIRDQSLKYLQASTERMAKAGELNRIWLEYDMKRKILSEEEKEHFYMRYALIHPVFACIRDIANTYEDMAIAIEESAVEEKMMQRSFATNLRWFWPHLEPFLSLYRNNLPRENYPHGDCPDLIPYDNHPHGEHPNPKVFSHCAALAKKWQGKEL